MGCGHLTTYFLSSSPSCAKLATLHFDCLLSQSHCATTTRDRERSQLKCCSLNLSQEIEWRLDSAFPQSHCVMTTRDRERLQLKFIFRCSSSRLRKTHNVSLRCTRIKLKHFRCTHPQSYQAIITKDREREQWKCRSNMPEQHTRAYHYFNGRKY